MVSMSFTAGENILDKWSYDSSFSGHAGITFLAASGDSGAPGGYPAYSPYVVAVGGTSLTLSGGNYGGEVGWSGSGGGLSVLESQPSYQQALVIHNGNSIISPTGTRAMPDVAFDADPNTGVAIYDSYDGGSNPWFQVGGTSVGTPCWAGLIAIADQIRVSAGLTNLSGPTQTLPSLYSLPAGDFHDITSGTSTGSPNYTAAAGYDLVTGLGTPEANLLVPDLALGPVADLTLTMTHVGNFTQGDVGDTYTITVSNSGSGATSGAVSLVDALPAGLTATAMSGTGWTINLATLTATRSDPLAPGGSYPALTVTVDVATNAPANLTNTAVVSGGGEVITANDTSSDLTTVNQLPLVTVGNAGAITFIRGGPAVAVAPSLTVTDSSSADLLSATVSLSGDPLDAGHEFLSADTTGTSVTASYNSASGVLTLSGSDTLADYQQVLRSVTYIDTLAATTNTGNRTLIFSVSDASDASAPVSSTVAFDVAPQVVGVYVSGSAWQPGCFNALAAAGVGDATLGFELVSGTGQLSNANVLGWVNLDTVSIVFSKPVSGVMLSSLSLGDSSNNGGPSAGITVSGETNPSSTVAAFTLSGPLTSNKYFLDLAAAGITDAAGAALDGEWTTSVSTFAAGSGDGAPGGDFIFRFNVLAGDVNGDGKVSSADVNAMRSQPLGMDTATNWQYDVNGDGKLSSGDVNAIRSQPLTTIASFPEPILPSSGSPTVQSATTDGVVRDMAWLGQAASSSDCGLDQRHEKDLAIQALDAVLAQYGRG